MRTIFSLAVFIVLASSAHGALLLWDRMPSGVAAVGDTVRASLFLDTQGEDVNAIEGVVRVSPSLGTPALYDGNSVVSIWIDPPRYDVSAGTIAFSGIMPAGYAGRQGKLFEIVFYGGRAGVSSLEVISARVLKDDGKGTEAALTSRALEIVFVAGIPTSSVAAIPDRVPPEEFIPIVASDASVFDERFFLAFATTDKGAGIDRYEVMEVSSASRDPELNRWHTSESPYLLYDQRLDSDIYVRAVDKEGNFRIVKVDAAHPSQPASSNPWYRVLVIVVVVLLVGYLRARARRGLAV